MKNAPVMRSVLNGGGVCLISALFPADSASIRSLMRYEAGRILQRAAFRERRLPRAAGAQSESLSSYSAAARPGGSG